ncbi:serine/threonine-protein kinase [Actinotalea fermentans]|uniref:serine/threonine-protein kinase n=1 Tax=Actinotalea fermentans TaxID=43671 RepID=UPI0011BDA3C5|nr:serine/threonine-protein kinase [Actinotalea fermentans]
MTEDAPIAVAVSEAGAAEDAPAEDAPAEEGSAEEGSEAEGSEAEGSEAEQPADDAGPAEAVSSADDAGPAESTPPQPAKAARRTKAARPPRRPKAKPPAASAPAPATPALDPPDDATPAVDDRLADDPPTDDAPTSEAPPVIPPADPAPRPEAEPEAADEPAAPEPPRKQRASATGRTSSAAGRAPSLRASGKAAKTAKAAAQGTAAAARTTSPTAPSAPPAPGAPGALPEEVGGYRILGALGRGGMGAVYKARDGDGRVVALKLLHAHLDDPEARERLSREVASLQKVRHAGVARVLDAEIESTEAFVVTELVPGRDLARHVSRSGALPPEHLLLLGSRLREALDVVHAAGVLHRDLTPGNVMVTADGPVLIDFGLAQAVEDARMTSTGLVTGTPGYVSPDLLDGEAPTRDSDWWGWAAVLTFAATGRPPFGKGTIGTVLTRVRAGDPDLAGLPSVLADALRGALAVDPAQRTGPDDVVAALEQLAADAPESDSAADDDAESVQADDAGVTAVLVADADERADEEADPAVVVTAVGAPADLATGLSTTRVLPDTWTADDDAARLGADEVDEVDDQAYDDEVDDEVDEAYGDEAYEEYDEYDDEAYDEDDEGYDEDRRLPEPDFYPTPPARRTGTVAALALPFLALGLARPGAAFAVALVVAALLRSVELDAEALERRRARRGARPSDRVRAVVTWPWYLVRGTLGVVPVLVVGGAVVVLVGGVTWWLIEAGHWTIAPLVPGQGSGLLRGNLPWVGRAWVGVMAAIGLAMVWFGPMARTHRDGARRALATIAPGPWGALAAVVVGVVVAVVLAMAMLGQDVVWWPLGGHPRLG